MAISQKMKNEAFTLIEAAAAVGDRCPINQPFGPLPVGVVAALYKDGMIRGEIVAGNFRRITILTGPHAGKRTAAPPNMLSKPYRIVDKDGASKAIRKVAP